MFSWKKRLLVAFFTVSLAVGMFFVFRFYSDRNENANVSKNADTPLVSQMQSDFGNGKVFSRSEMRAIIEGFGEPSEEDIKVLQKDERYALVMSDLSSLGVSESVRSDFLNFLYSFWFQQEKLGEKEESGEINMDGFDFGLGILVEDYSKFLQEKLTDDQYLSYEGQRKPDFRSEFPGFSSSTNGYSKITSIFPTIRNGEHPEIQSAEDLYKVVPKEAIEKIIAGTRKRSKIQREAVRAFRLEQISEEEYEKQIEASTQAMRDAIDGAVTPEQEIFLFGYEF